jgi:photosystem II stability/assembly factor-like uncharacterized protein
MRYLYLSLIFLLTLILFLPGESLAQWTQVAKPNNIEINALVSVGTNIFAGFNGYSSNYGGIYRSTDNGDTWSVVDSGLVKNGKDTINILHLAVMGNTIIAGTDSDGIFISTDNGDSWEQSNNGIADNANQVLSITAIDTNNSKIYVALDYWLGAFVSSDTGKSWQAINNGFTLNYPPTIFNFGFVHGNIYAFSRWLYISTDEGANWMVDSSIEVLGKDPGYATLGDVMFWGAGDKILRSTNYGVSWSSFSTPYDTIIEGTVGIYTLISYKNNLIAGRTDGAYFSSDSGATWNDLNQGWNKYSEGGNVSSLTESYNYLFAGTAGYGIWRIPLSEIITGIEKAKGTLPTNYSLRQNYPNPFNPTTTINYQLPRSGFVTIKIYDMLGRLVKNLVDGNKTAGNYSVKFSGSSLASGVYIYQLIVYNEQLTRKYYSSSKKLILLK